MANYILPNYPHQVGAQKWVIVDHSGPSSYVTGGETFLPGAFGMGSIDFIGMSIPAATMSGNYHISVAYTTGTSGQPVKSATFVWSSVSTGSEVAQGTNLSGEIIRLMLVGGLG